MAEPKNPPLLLMSGLTRRIYIVTHYTRRPDGGITASTKYDVTDQFFALMHDVEVDEAERAHAAAPSSRGDAPEEARPDDSSEED